MKPEQRYAWILNWLGSSPAHAAVDVLNADFVCAYADATGAAAFLHHFGAPRCPQVGRDLAAMFKAGTLSRSAVGLAAGDASSGFPKWVFVYSKSPGISAETSQPQAERITEVTHAEQPG